MNTDLQIIQAAHAVEAKARLIRVDLCSSVSSYFAYTDCHIVRK